MKSLRFVLKQYPLTMILYGQELLLFLFVFVPLRGWLNSLSSSNYFARSFSMDFFAEMVAGRGNTGSPFFILMGILILVFALTRILLMAGVFESMMSHYPGFRRFLFDCGAHGRRFIILFFLYGIPMLILALIISRLTGNVSENAPNQMMPVYMVLADRGILLVLSILFSYLHTAARYRTILENRVCLAFRIKFSLFVRFFGYQFLSVVLGLLLITAGAILLTKPGGWMTFAAFMCLQLAIIFRIMFKLASYKVLS